MTFPSAVRAGLRIAALAVLLLVCAPLHLIAKLLVGRSHWPRRFLGACAWIIGVRVKIEGDPIEPHSLIVANHVSWIDILLLGGSVGAAFVSKDDLGHPFVHWLADQNKTIYIRRAAVRDSKLQALAIAKALERVQPVALFPEGTVGPGTRLLPFRSTLLEASNIASRDVTIRPVALDYGPIAPDIAWFEIPVKRNFFAILGRPGTFPVTIRLLGALKRGGNRKYLAAAARQAIADALGFNCHAPSPIGPRQ